MIHADQANCHLYLYTIIYVRFQELEMKYHWILGFKTWNLFLLFRSCDMGHPPPTLSGENLVYINVKFREFSKCCSTLVPVFFLSFFFFFCSEGIKTKSNSVKSIFFQFHTVMSSKLYFIPLEDNHWYISFTPQHAQSVARAKVKGYPPCNMSVI